MKVLVTGGAGFLGSYLVAHLSEREHEVTVADRAKDGFDLRDPLVLRYLFEHAQPEVVIHLAALVGRLANEDNPVEACSDNVGLTTLLARKCAASGARLVNVSSSEAAYNGIGIYGMTKRWGEEAVRHYCPNSTTIRPWMAYGPEQRSERLGYHAALTVFLRRALQGDTLPVHRGAIRSWCYVTDVVRGIALVATSPEVERKVWNVGEDRDFRTMREVAELACELTGASTDLIEETDAPKGQVLVKRFTASRVRRLGWKPEVTLREGMEQTMTWLLRESTGCPARSTGGERCGLERGHDGPHYFSTIMAEERASG